jgi:hypothetical protein
VDVWRGIQQGTGVAAEEGELGGWEIEDAERRARICGGNGREAGEVRVDGETGVDDFLRCQTAEDHAVSGGGIRHQPAVTSGAQPDGVDLDGVRDHHEKRDFFPHARRDPVHEIWVKRVGADDGGGPEVLNEPGERSGDPAHDR